MKKAAEQNVQRLFGGPEGDRTLDLTDANRTRSQLRYRPKLPCRACALHDAYNKIPHFSQLVKAFLQKKMRRKEIRPQRAPASPRFAAARGARAGNVRGRAALWRVRLFMNCINLMPQGIAKRRIHGKPLDFRAKICTIGGRREKSRFCGIFVDFCWLIFARRLVYTFWCRKNLV